jgi:hypothetical protein
MKERNVKQERSENGKNVWKKDGKKYGEQGYEVKKKEVR